MKTELTPEESQHLIKLGVPEEKVSDKISYGFAGSYPIFSLDDFLNGEILPKEIETKDGVVWLDIQLTNETSSVSYEYVGHGGCKAYYDAEELIDALYQLTCWYYDEFLK